MSQDDTRETQLTDDLEAPDQEIDLRVPARRTRIPAVSRPARRPSFWSGRVAFVACFVAVLLLGAAFRFYDLNWDQGQHLHPDERGLTQVLSQLRWPASFSEYLDEAHSPLNPRNVGFSFFAYGTLPTTIIKGVALAVNQQGYDQIYMVGRALSALLDVGSLVLVFLLGLRLYRDRRIALLAMFLLACTVLAIQQAHFMVVDPWASFFLLASTYFLVGVQQRGGLANYAGVGFFFGLALASKLSVYTFVLVVALVGVERVWQVWRNGGRSREVAIAAEQVFVRLIFSGVVAFVVFRVAQPDVFKGPGFLDIGLSDRWLENLKEVGGLVSGTSDTPPGEQWTGRIPLVFPWLNMVLLGFGLPLGLAAWAGWAGAAWRLVRRRAMAHLVPVVWIAILFLSQGLQWVMSIRYFLPIYPLLALLAAWLLIRIWERAHAVSEHKEVGAEGTPDRVPAGERALGSFGSRLHASLQHNKRIATLRNGLTLSPARAMGLIVLVAGGTLLWALTFSSIYTETHSRVQATRWIFANVPVGARLGIEYWDDPLPIRMDGKDPFANMYTGVQLSWYDNDSPAKLQQALGWLDQTDYIILSSNRLYDSISRMPTRYPMTIRYYAALFDGSLGFSKVAEFNSYPTFLGIRINDQGGDEAFSVYDHPRVQIFRKTPAYSRANTEQLLGNVDWSRVLPLTPHQATAAPTGLLLPVDLVAIYRQAGTWTELFNTQSAAAAAPVLVWALLLEILGVLAMPYLFVATRGLPDRGYSLSKILGLLLPAVVIWLLASLHIISFSRLGILLVFLAVGIGAVFIVHARWDEMRDFWRKRRSLLLLEEGLFWGCFLLFLLVRVANPDLWHDVRGGEKPMDFAFLNAVVKSPYFPPYDPWFSDGFINYYYFGFVPVAMLIKVAGILPEIAYNLAIPTLFALTAVGAFGVALGLLARQRLVRLRDTGFALLGACFVTLCGNLAEVKLLGDGFAGLAGGAAGTSPVSYIGRVWSGLGTFLGGKALPINLDWWYWNASRVISHPSTEAGPINEFPAFTFLFGDLHAHALDLPFTLLVLGLTLAIIRAGPVRRRGDWVLLALLALATGALWATNTWDFPTYSIVVLAALLLREWHSASRVGWAMPAAAAWRWLVVLAGGYLIFLPFHKAYAAGFSSAELWQGSHTPLDEYLLMHGFFLFLIGSAMLADLVWGGSHNGVVRALRLRMRYWRRLPRLRLRYFERSLVRHSFLLTLTFRALGVVVVAALLLALAGYGTSGVIILLLALVALLFFRRKPQVMWQLALILAGLGLSLTLLVEFVVLKGDISRLNTVFKFYFQAWTLFALAAVLATARIWRRGAGIARSFRVGWSVCFALLFSASLLYPLFATPARIADRMSPSTPPTLDGTAFMEQSTYAINQQKIALEPDREATEWLRDHIAGSPVVAEANTYPVLYGWGSRIAMFTGLPDIVGWDYHERQQRSIIGGNVVTNRIKDVQHLYATPDASEAHTLLRQYGAGLLVVGALERSITPAEGIAKFAASNGVYWDLLYDQDGVQIYSVRP